MEAIRAVITRENSELEPSRSYYWNNSFASETLAMVTSAVPLLPLNPGPFILSILHIDTNKDLLDVGVG